MAGKRQHYLPRFLQRGFLDRTSDGEGRADRTWLHRRSSEPRLVGIAVVGVEDWFYSRRGEPGEVTLDDIITQIERDFSRDVGKLRSSPAGTQVASGHAARTTVPLVMRTAHLRRTISEGADAMLRAAEELLTDPDRLSDKMGGRRPALSRSVSDAIADTAAKLGSAPRVRSSARNRPWFGIVEAIRVGWFDLAFGYTTAEAVECCQRRC